MGKSLEKTIQKHVSYVSYHEYLRLWYWSHVIIMPPPPLKNATLRANEMIKLSKKNVVIGGERGGGGCCEELGFDMAREKGYSSCAHFVKVTQDFYDYFIVEWSFCRYH